MQFEKITLDEIKPSEYNPRIISEEELEKLEKNIKEFGWVITTPVGKIVEDENFDLKMKSIADYIGIKHYSAN